MPAILTHKAIMLLARDRLQQLRDSLEAKRVSGLAVNPLDRQVLYLAKRAVEMLSTAPQAQVRFPTRPLTTALGTGVSTYAVLGSLGPALPAYAALAAPGQSWAGDIMRKGTPDANREAVVTRSLDFLLEFWQRAEGKIRALPDGEQAGTRDKLRAYALGHLCRVAGEMIVNPYLDDLEWHLGSALHPTRLGREVVEASVDSAVAAQVLQSPGTRRGAVWTAWWPGVDDVPESFFDAYAEAFEAVYLGQGRPLGLAEFEEHFTKAVPPPMSHRLVRDGYQGFRGLLERGYDWSYGDWLVALLPLFAPMAVAMPFTALLDQAKDLLSDRPHDEAKAWAEALAFPLSATALVPLGASIYLAAGTSLGVGTETIVGLIIGGLVAATAVVFFSTLGADLPAWVPIVFCFALPLAAELGYFIWLQTRGGGEKFHSLLGWAFLAHVVVAGLSSLAYVLFRDWLNQGPGEFLFWLAILLWLAVVTGLWLLSALALRQTAAPEVAGDGFATDRRHFVRLFDDVSLFHDPANATPSLAQLFYPSGRRKLLRIWWEGDQDMYIRPRRYSVEFSVTGTDPGDIQTILAPIGPMTLSEFAGLLRRTVKDGSGTAGGLRVERAYEADPDYDLPPGETFADHGDTDDTVQTETQHRDRANAWFHLGKSRDEREYFLYHAPKALQALQVGPGSVVVPDLRDTQDTGAGTIGPAAGVGAGPSDVDGTGTRFLTFFRVGDTIEGGGTQRTVTAIASDTRLTTVLPLGLGGAGTAYHRLRQDRTAEAQGTGQAAVAALALSTVVGSGGSAFAAFFMPGDIIRVGAEERRVVGIASDSSLTVDAPFPVTAAADFYRMPTESAEGHEFLARPGADLMAGDSVMDLAADLAVMLCLGGTSHLLTEDERRASPLGAPAPVNKVVQVFRNWNLDRRRLNEWRMLITGGGVSEKRGAPEAPDPALPPLPAGWTLRSTRGEGTATALGWIPLFRKWLDVARRPGVSSADRVSLRPGDPTNLELSRAVAFLFDMADPDPTPP
jgi:hypothetical protein